MNICEKTHLQSMVSHLSPNVNLQFQTSQITSHPKDKTLPFSLSSRHGDTRVVGNYRHEVGQQQLQLAVLSIRAGNSVDARRAGAGAAAVVLMGPVPCDQAAKMVCTGMGCTAARRAQRVGMMEVCRRSPMQGLVAPTGMRWSGSTMVSPSKWQAVVESAAVSSSNTAYHTCEMVDDSSPWGWWGCPAGMEAMVVGGELVDGSAASMGSAEKQSSLHQNSAADYMRCPDPVAAVLEVEVLQRTELCCQVESPVWRQPPYLDRSTQIARLVSGVPTRCGARHGQWQGELSVELVMVVVSMGV